MTHRSGTNPRPNDLAAIRRMPRPMVRGKEISPMPEIVVEVRGGLVAEIYSDQPHSRVVVIDWDEIDSPERQGRVGFRWDPCASLTSMPDDTRGQYQQAIEDPPS